MNRFLAAVVLILLVCAACGDDVDTETSDDPGDSATRPSVAGDWILRSLTSAGAPVPLPDGDLEITIELGQISGNLGCNSFFGEIDAADDGTLTIGGLGQTEMACEDAARMDFEFAYGQALSSATSWAVTPAELTFSGDDITISYVQAPAPVHQPFEGTVWHFDTIYEGSGPEGSATNRADMDGVTLVIADGEAVLVGPDCGGSISVIEYSDGREGGFEVMSLGPIDSSPACEVVGLARAGLSDSSGFMIDENRLTFVGDDGQTIGFTARS